MIPNESIPDRSIVYNLETVIENRLTRVRNPSNSNKLSLNESSNPGYASLEKKNLCSDDLENDNFFINQETNNPESHLSNAIESNEKKLNVENSCSYFKDDDCNEVSVKLTEFQTKKNEERKDKFKNKLNIKNKTFTFL